MTIKVDDNPFPFFHPLSRRFHLVLLLMLHIFCVSWMRGNLAMTMTCMVNSTAVSLQASNASQSLGLNLTKIVQIPQKCGEVVEEGEIGKVVNDYGGTIIWDSKVQNLLFSGTFWGSLFTIVPSGYIADRSSPSNMLQINMVIYILCTVFFPYTAMYSSYYFVFINRILMGFGEGIMAPAVSAIIQKWIPNHEKSTAAAIFTSGNQFAGIIGLPIAAYFCASSWKWPSVFYCASLLGVFWLVLWKLTMKNSPHKTTMITDAEKAYLERTVGVYRPQKKNLKIPWKHIFTSVPFLSCVSCGFAGMMAMMFIQLYLPTFFKEVLFLKVVDNGFYSAAPFACQFFSKLFWSLFMDKLRGKYLSNTAACKLSGGLSTFFIAIFLLLLGYIPDCESPGTAVLLVCGLSLGAGLGISGFYASLLSLAPPFTGLLSSIHMVCGFLGMLSTPQLVSFFRVNGTLEEWRLIFFITSGCIGVAGTFFVIFGEAEIQPWAKFETVGQEEKQKLEEDENIEVLVEN